MGQIDRPLSDQGRDEAQRAAERLSGWGGGIIFTSPLRRARETADVLSSVLKARILVDDGLMERHWGVYQGRAITERPVGLENPEGGESRLNFEGRVVAAFNGLLASEPALVVSHRGVFRALAALLGQPGALEPVPNAKPIRINPTPTGWEIFFA